MRKLVFALAAASALSAVPANAATIVNGSFEQGAFDPGSFTTVNAVSTAITGWTVSGGSVDYIGSYWQAADGARSIDLAGNAPGTIEQALATVANKLYILTFSVARNPDGGTNPRTGFVDTGNGQELVTYLGAGNRANMQWQTVSYQFQALSDSTTIKFAADPATSGTFYGLALDNVSISAVPEASTWAMMILGLGLVGVGLRRRRHNVQVRYA